MVRNYDKLTVDSPNPIARISHRNRTRRSVQLALRELDDGRLLDFGCGTGRFVSDVLEVRADAAIGYEPYMEERIAGELPIYNSVDAAIKHGPFTLVTLFETIEHLTISERTSFLSLCETILPGEGRILISAPIEIGPAVVAKELNRRARREGDRCTAKELLAAGVLGRPAKRAVDIKSNHKGFDFREALTWFADHGWRCTILEYSPLPIRTWYGNSQVYVRASRWAG